jgi:hypothetical protein
MPEHALPRLGPAVYTTPAAHDPLDVGGRPCASHRKEARFRLRCGHPGQGTDLGVGQLAAGQRFSEEGQPPEGAGNPDPFARRAQVEPHPPREPGGAGAEARVPAPAGVELPDQREQACGGGVEVRGE